MFGFGELDSDFDYDGSFDFTQPIARKTTRKSSGKSFTADSDLWDDFDATEATPVESDPYDFWKHEPTRSIPRVGARRSKPAARATRSTHRPRNTRNARGGRQHGDATTQIPVIDADGVIILDDTACRPFDAETGLGGRTPVGRVRTHQAGFGGNNNPLMRRIGAMVVLLAFGVPVAMALRGGDSGRDSLGLGNAEAIAAAQAEIAATSVVANVDAATQTETPLVTVAAETGGVVTVGATAAPTQEAPVLDQTAAPVVQAAPVCAKTYAVVLGDGWLRIADAHSVTLDELLTSNAANTNTFLMAGSTICVPAHATAPTTPAVTTPAVTTPAAVAYVAPFSLPCAKSYTVVLGDGWLRIASRHSVAMKDLLKVNAATASTFLMVGKKICVPANASTPAPPTTTKPKSTRPAPTPTLNPPTRTYTYAEVEAIIRDIWPDDLEEEALRIAHRESRLNPRAQNYCCYGLFQIYFNVHKKWLAEMGVTSGEQLLDPTVAAKAGLKLYQRNGWGPWKL